MKILIVVGVYLICVFVLSLVMAKMAKKDQEEIFHEDEF